MAKIVYKKGLEGQNKIDCIEGIEIEMMNGQCALIYPKYADFPTTSVPTIVYKKRRMRKVSSWMTDASVPTTVYKKPQTVYMVTSERAEKEDLQSLIDETKLFASFDDAKEYAKRKFEEVLKIFGVTKDNVKVEESEKENSEELYSIHSNFLYSGHEWDIWVTIQEKEIQ